MTRIIIKSRFNGPPDSGNGGYVCGIVGSAIEGPSIVTLRKPPPLERELILETLDERHAVLRDGETLIGETIAFVPSHHSQPCYRFCPPKSCPEDQTIIVNRNDAE